MLRSHWWRAVATVARLVGDLDVAEQAVQEACLAALSVWPRDGLPANPGAWLTGTAHHKALDWLRREQRRTEKEGQAAAGLAAEYMMTRDESHIRDDQLALIFACCHPALDVKVRVPLTLRAVCGLTTSEIASVFLTSETAMAQRLVRAKQKIRQAGIPFEVPGPNHIDRRLRDVLSVVYLMFTEGHRSSTQTNLVREELCSEAIHLADELVRLLPDQPEVKGLLALLLLTDARQTARLAETGRVTLLAEQDRAKWDRAKVARGTRLLTDALATGRPGRYQLEAAIAACHAEAPDMRSTDWRQIVALYDRLLETHPSPVVAANRAAAVAALDGPTAGLVLLDRLAAKERLQRWAPLQVARAALLEQTDRLSEATEAYRAALRLGLPAAEAAHVRERLQILTREPPSSAA